MIIRKLTLVSCSVVTLAVGSLFFTDMQNALAAGGCKTIANERFKLTVPAEAQVSKQRMCDFDTYQIGSKTAAKRYGLMIYAGNHPNYPALKSRKLFVTTDLDAEFVRMRCLWKGTVLVGKEMLFKIPVDSDFALTHVPPENRYSYLHAIISDHKNSDILAADRILSSLQIVRAKKEAVKAKLQPVRK